jgi:predicted DNA-binding transcriptional regulator AlpA
MKSAPQKPFDDLPDLAMIQLRQLLNYGVIPFSAATIWRKCRSGEFPTPIKISAGITAWRVGDIRQYLEAVCNTSKGGSI